MVTFREDDILFSITFASFTYIDHLRAGKVQHECIIVRLHTLAWEYAESGRPTVLGEGLVIL
jgi:hypothetical protein